VQKQLLGIVAELETAQTRLHRLADQLPDARWKSRPGPDRWSAAECVEHLNLTTKAFLPLLRRALERSTRGPVGETRSAGKVVGVMYAGYQRDFLGWLFWWMVGPMPRLGKIRFPRVKTPPDFVPKSARGRADTVAEFDRLQAELIDITNNVEGFPLGDMKITSPFGGRIKYNFFSALRLLPRHQERHLDQAEAAIAGN